MMVIKENVRALKDAGLQLVVTVCDQDPSNIEAIKELRKQYVANCTRNIKPGKKNLSDFFVIMILIYLIFC